MGLTDPHKPEWQRLFTEAVRLDNGSGYVEYAVMVLGPTTLLRVRTYKAPPQYGFGGDSPPRPTLVWPESIVSFPSPVDVSSGDSRTAKAE